MFGVQCSVFGDIGDGIHGGREVGLMGNFSTLSVSADKSVVLVGENLVRAGCTANTLQAIIT